MTELILKTSVEFLMIISTINILTQRNTIHSLYSLIITFVLSVVYISQIGGEYLGMLILIIYVGALAIIFLFVVMLIEIKESQKNLAGTYPMAGILSFIISSQLFLSFKNNHLYNPLNNPKLDEKNIII